MLKYQRSLGAVEVVLVSSLTAIVVLQVGLIHDTHLEAESRSREAQAWTKPSMSPQCDGGFVMRVEFVLCVLHFSFMVF